MLYGIYSLQLHIEKEILLKQLESIISWNEALKYHITIGKFSGGFLLDPRLPYKPDECLYQDDHLDINILIFGCIYNRAAICAEHDLNLVELTDASLAGKLFLLYGTKFVEKLNGDFTILVYQPRSNNFYIFRDHLGIRPLAYTVEAHSIIFSSDIIGLCRTFHQPGSFNIEYLLARFKFIDYTKTPNKNVHKLYPGHFLRFDSKGLHIEKYWEPEKIRTDYSLTQLQVLSEVKSLLLDAVHIRADQKFHAGAHVSGGLDSGIVSVLARKEYSSQKTFFGYSWSPSNIPSEKAKFDERHYAQETCDWAKISAVYVPMSFEEFVEISKDVLVNQGYFQEKKIIDKVQQHGVNLVFSGWGGDEFISRGGHGIDWDLFFSCDWRNFFKKNPITSPKNFLGKIVFKFIFPFFHILKRSIKKEFSKKSLYLKKEFKSPNKYSLKKWHFTPSGRKSCLGMLYNYHIPDRTEAWYINSIRHGFEYRYPLLDKRIVEYMLKVPTKYRINEEHSRLIVREIAKSLLPETVRLRVTKVDPVCRKSVLDNYTAAGKLYKREIIDFKNNPYLHCFDFELIEKDLEHFSEKDDNESLNKLYYDLFRIKTIHDFTQVYANRV